MFERLRDVLTKSGVDLSDEELLDVLWLAGNMPPAAGPLVQAVAPSRQSVPGHVQPLPNGSAPPADRSAPEVPEGPGPERPLHAAPPTNARQEAGATPHRAFPVRAADRRVLNTRELRLGKSLRPLRQRFPDRRRHEIDIARTVAAMAETGLPETVTRPARTRWLSLALLVDDGVSMVLWQRLASEVRTLMERAGAFRDVRVYGLDTRSPQAPLLSNRPFEGKKAYLPPASVSDPTGDTLVLVISDGVGEAWWDGRMRKALDLWARCGPSALVHALPSRLWASSGITAQQWQITTRRRGSPNTAWRVTDLVLPPDLVNLASIPIPVLQPSPTAIAEWSRLIASPSTTARLPLWTGGQGLPTRPYADTRHARGAETVLSFRAAASPEAYRLAAHLAAFAPLTPPVMRLVQSALGPPTDTGHLVEVFLGGLMRQIASEGPARLPQHQHFDFSEDACRILLSTVPPQELLRTTRAIGDYMETNIGRSPSFTAWVGHPSGSAVVGEPGQSFTRLKHQLLRRLGVPPVVERSGDSNSERTQEDDHVKPVPAPHAERSTSEPRRFLIATAVSRYPKCPEWDRPELVEARQRIIDLFTGELGYQHHTTPGLDPTQAQLTSQLRAFARSPDRREDDVLAVYVASHGEVLNDGEHLLLVSDTDPDDIAGTALPTVNLARALLRETRVRRLLLVLDTSYSGQGSNNLAAAALDSEMVVVSSAQPHEHAQTGLFPRLLAEAISNVMTAGHNPSTLSLPAVVQRMNDNPDRPAFQRISLSQIGLIGESPAFLPNPRHDPRLSSVDLAIQQTAEFDEHARRRETELARHLLVRAMGRHDNSDQSWWFCGRHTALADITSWLRDTAGPTCQVITADPGSGKSAVLGLIAILTHPERRHSVPVNSLGLAPDQVPEAGAVDVTMHAQGLADSDVLQGLAAAAKVRAHTIGELLEALRTTDSGRPFTVLIDALDEAATPDTLCSQLLRPLIDHSNGRIRLLLGTRRFLLSRLGIPSVRVIDLDAPRYADPEALQAYTARVLLEAHPASPYLRSPEALQPVAEAVATAAGRSFLVARITAGALAAADHVVRDPSARSWLASLPGHAGQAMFDDLTNRLGVDAQRTTDLLRPLAFAQGQGLPWEDIWASLASALSGGTYTNDDLVELRRTAGSYVVEATESDRSVYRLYHEALAEHLRDGDPQVAHSAFTDILTNRVPHRSDATRDWSRAHPYTLSYLAFHATQAGRLDEVLGDAEFLVHAAPHSLIPHLNHAGAQPAQLAATVYRTSTGLHATASPAVRRQILALDAARAGATKMQQQLTRRIPEGDWSPRWASGSALRPTPRETLTGHTGAVRAVACTTTMDGTSIAVTGSNDSTVRLWDLHTGTPIGQPLTGHTGPIDAVACTTTMDGTSIAVTGSNDSTVRLWDLHTGTPIGQPLTGHTGAVRAVACTTTMDGTSIAVTGSNDSTVRLWDLHTGTPISQPLTGHTGPIDAVACTTTMDGTSIAVTGSNDSTVRLWDLHTGTPIGQPLTGHTGAVRAVACTTTMDGTSIAVTGSNDSTVRLWDLHTGTPISQPLTGHTGPIDAVACTTTMDGTSIAVTGSNDSTVRLWDLHTGTPIGFLEATKPLAVAMSSEGDLVLGFDHDVAVFRRRSAHETRSTSDD